MTNTDTMDIFVTSNRGTLVNYTGIKQYSQSMLTVNPDEFRNFFLIYAKAYQPAFVFKISSGVGQWTYMTSNNFLGISTTVQNSGTAAFPGAIAMDLNGKLNEIRAWFDAHTGTRKFVKGAIIFTITFVAANEASIIVHFPSWAIVPFGAIVTAAANYVQTHTEWPIVGARKK